MSRLTCELKGLVLGIFANARWCFTKLMVVEKVMPGQQIQLVSEIKCNSSFVQVLEYILFYLCFVRLHSLYAKIKKIERFLDCKSCRIFTYIVIE